MVQPDDRVVIEVRRDEMAVLTAHGRCECGHLNGLHYDDDEWISRNCLICSCARSG